MNLRSAMRVMGLTIVCVAWGSDVGVQSATIHGWVLDSACAITKGLDKPIEAAK